MGASYYSKRTVRSGQSVFLATPAYEAVKPGYAYCLALTTAELTRHGIPFELGIMHGNCHVDDGRNTLVRQFMEGTCTDMLFLDSDLMWNSKDVLRILAHKYELVCGAYPLKSNNASYPIGRIFNTEPDGMLEVSYAPTGFMRIQRSVFEKLYPKQSRHGKERPTAVYFERRFNGKTRDGGDVTFCRKWIEIGGKVMVDPTFIFSHIGDQRWQGKFMSYLAKEENRAKHIAECKDPLIAKPITYLSGKEGKKDSVVSQIITRIQNGEDDEQTFRELADAYGNQPWAAPHDFLQVIYKIVSSLPADATVIECGSGLSTVVMAATGRQIITLEESEDYANKTHDLLKECGLESRIMLSPLGDNGWYEKGEQLFGFQADAIVIDGPRRSDIELDGTLTLRENVDRLFPVQKGKHHNIVKPNAVLVCDDYRKPGNVPGNFATGGTEQRPFCAGTLEG